MGAYWLISLAVTENVYSPEYTVAYFELEKKTADNLDMLRMQA